jgi:hypothetical protein
MRTIPAFALALFLLACSGSSTVSLDDIVAQIQKTCGFVTSVEDVAKVIVTLISGFDPNSAGGVPVAADIAMLVSMSYHEDPGSHAKSHVCIVKVNRHI